MKLLIIEDEASLQELMTAALKKEGYIVENAMDYNEAIDKLGAYSYDCILLDLNLPGGNGLDILEHVKKCCNKLNVIIISARDSIDDKVRGLELGADDYLAKPFHLAELSARIRSVARRSRNDGELTYKAGNVVLEDVSQRLTVAGKEVSLLKFLFQRTGSVSGIRVMHHWTEVVSFIVSIFPEAVAKVLPDLDLPWLIRSVNTVVCL